MGGWRVGAKHYGCWLLTVFGVVVVWMDGYLALFRQLGLEKKAPWGIYRLGVFMGVLSTRV